MPPPQKKLHREAKRKVEDKPDERLKSARRALSAIFTAMPGPQTPEQPNQTVGWTWSLHLPLFDLNSAMWQAAPRLLEVLLLQA